MSKEQWHLKEPVFPIDECFYDIELKDGTIHKNMEYWAFNDKFFRTEKKDKETYNRISYDGKDVYKFKRIVK